jgi:hypothetical protein
MKGVKFASTALGLIIGVLAAVPANAWDRGTPQVFAHLPQRVEGLAVGPTTLPGGAAGSIFAASNGGTTPNLFVIPHAGCLLPGCTVTPIRITGGGAPGVSNNLLGVAFSGTNLLVVDSTNSQVLNVARDTGAASAFITLPDNAPAGATLNAITTDASGNIYVSDSTNGIIWRTPSTGGVATNWFQDPLLSPSTGGQPELTPNFGANGLAFTADGTRVLVANTAFRQII